MECNMNEILNKNEISPQQDAAIEGDLNKIAYAHGVGLGELKAIIDKNYQEEQKAKNEKRQEENIPFDKLDKDLYRLKAYIGHRFLQHAGQFNIFYPNIKITPQNYRDVIEKNRKQFYVLCDRYNIIPPKDYVDIRSPQRKYAEKLIEQLNQRIGKIEREIKQLMEKGLLPGKTIRVKRSSGTIEDGWIIKEYVENGAMVVDPTGKWQKTITVDKLLSLN